MFLCSMDLSNLDFQVDSWKLLQNQEFILVDSSERLEIQPH
jgi:hypothetical protein